MRSRHPMASPGLHRASYELCMPNELKGVFASLLTAPKTKNFTLDKIDAFPGHLLLSAHQLDTLRLAGDLSFNQEGGALEAFRAREPPAGYLKSLVCSGSAVANDVLRMRAKVGTHYGLQFRRIKPLKVGPLSLNPNEPKNEVLEAVDCLHTLHTAITTAFRSQHMQAFPLDTLNPRSLATLSHLTLWLTHWIDPDGDSAQKTVTNPYLFLCDSFLGQLHNLETLDLEIQLYHGLHPQSYGSQWGRLVEVLTVPRGFPQLKRVRLAAVIMMESQGRSEQTWPVEMQKQEAEELEGNLKTLVYAAQLRSLHDLEIGGRPIDFSFTTSITTEQKFWT